MRPKKHVISILEVVVNIICTVRIDDRIHVVVGEVEAIVVGCEEGVDVGLGLAGS